MSKVTSLFVVGFICALLFVNVHAKPEEYTILSESGAYNPGSLLTFTKVLDKLKDFTLPAGDEMLDKWIAAIKQVNKHLEAGDYSAIEKVGHETESVLRALLPSIPDKIVYAAVESLPNTFETELEQKLKDGSATLADMDSFFKFMSSTMVSAMAKTTPTAETLN